MASSQPIVQVLDMQGSVAAVVWCVCEAELERDSVVLNALLMTTFQIKKDQQYYLSPMGLKLPLHFASLDKVMVELIDEAHDLPLMMSHYEYFQSEVLNQIRVVQRGNELPLFHTFGDGRALWIRIKEFGGYQRNASYGILHQNSELLLIENGKDCVASPEKDIFDLKLVPGAGLNLCVNPVYFGSQNSSNSKIATVSFGEHSFAAQVYSNSAVPAGFLWAPDVLLGALSLDPKSAVKISLECAGKTMDVRAHTVTQYSSALHRWQDEDIEHIARTRSLESLIVLDSESVLTSKQASTGASASIKKVAIPKPKPTQLCDPKLVGQLRNFVLGTSRILLLDGQAGSGKSTLIRQVKEAVDRDFTLVQMQHVDCLAEGIAISKLPKASGPAVVVFDHFDELLESQSDSNGFTDTSLFIAWRSAILGLIASGLAKVALVVRSRRDFGRTFCGIASLPIDECISVSRQHQTRPTKLLAQAPYFGHDDASQLMERYLLHPLKFASLYQANGMKTSSGVLLTGPPGIGKTFLAESFLRKHQIRHVIVRGPELLDKYVGESEKAVRDLFLKLRTQRPMVVLFDELDSLVPMRGSSQAGVTDRIVNQFLTELDGTEDRSEIFVIGTSSRPDLIDKAILRPGRLDKTIRLEHPTLNEIESYLLATVADPDHVIKLLTRIEVDNVCPNWSEVAALAAVSEDHAAEQLLSAIRARSRTTPQPPSPPENKLSLM